MAKEGAILAWLAPTYEGAIAGDGDGLEIIDDCYCCYPLPAFPLIISRKEPFDATSACIFCSYVKGFS